MISFLCSIRLPFSDLNFFLVPLPGNREKRLIVGEGYGPNLVSMAWQGASVAMTKPPPEIPFKATEVRVGLLLLEQIEGRDYVSMLPGRLCRQRIGHVCFGYCHLLLFDRLFPCRVELQSQPDRRAGKQGRDHATAQDSVFELPLPSGHGLRGLAEVTLLLHLVLFAPPFGFLAGGHEGGLAVAELLAVRLDPLLAHCQARPRVQVVLLVIGL